MPAAPDAPTPSLRPADRPDDPERVSALAHRIWREHYTPIIGAAQVEYMLERFESPAAIRRQQEAGHLYFVAETAGEAVGYLAVVPAGEPGEWKLHKLYVAKALRGTGLGRRLLALSENTAAAAGAHTLWLVVNKRNPSVAAYERWGFRRTADLVTDIGAGFVMDDHRMEKRLGPSPGLPATGAR